MATSIWNCDQTAVLKPSNLRDMRTLRLFCFAVLVTVVLACGGGGSGVSTASSLAVTTDWTLRNQPGGGQSERLTLLRPNGVPVQSLSASYGGQTITQLVFSSLAAGTYILHGELYSATDLNGLRVGEMWVQLEVNGPVTHTLAVGASISSLRVTPAVATIKVPGSQQFYAEPTNSGGTGTFAASTTLTWTALGNVGTVDQSGIFFATTPGSGSVRVTHTPSSSSGSAAVTVTPSNAVTKAWTIMVYMNAANDLHDFSVDDMNEMERLAASNDVNIIVQWKQSQTAFPTSSFDGTRRYQVQHDTTSAIASTLVQNMGTAIDMGRPETVNDFIDWTKQFYPANRYGIVVWNHGNGWRRKPTDRAVSYDDATGSSIQIWELDQAFGSTPFEFIAWDASLMQMLEVAYEVRGHAKYVVGSEESPPGAGYPYTQALSKFISNPNDSTVNQVKGFVDAMLGESGYNLEKITESVLDTSKLPALASATDNLANQLLQNSSAVSALIPQIRAQAQSYSDHVSPPRYYRDLTDVCLLLESGTSIPSLVAASQNVRSAIANAVVWEGHNANSSKSHGISIDFTQGSIFLSSAGDYQKMKFATDTNWDDWLMTAP